MIVLKRSLRQLLDGFFRSSNTPDETELDREHGPRKAGYYCQLRRQ
jgi:hypothetical protein